MHSDLLTYAPNAAERYRCFCLGLVIPDLPPDPIWNQPAYLPEPGEIQSSILMSLR